MIPSGQGSQFRGRDSLRHGSAGIEIYGRVVLPMDDQRGNVDCREDLRDIDLAIHASQIDC
jgi:hypothetical protein